MEITKDTKSIFLDVMGDHPINRILDFLIIFRKFDYSKKDIARNSNVSYATLKYLWPELEARKIVKMTRKVGKAKMYRLNRENPITKQIYRMYWTITRSEKIKIELPN